MYKPIFQNNDLSFIWDKLDTLTPSNNPNGERYDFYFNSFESINKFIETTFYINPYIRDLGNKNFCVSGVLTHLYFSVELSNQNYDLYLIGYKKNSTYKNNSTNVFFILPVKNFTAVSQRYYFNFSPTNKADNLNNVIATQIIDIPIPSFDLNNDSIYFVLSNGINVNPLPKLEEKEIFVSASYSLNLITNP